MDSSKTTEDDTIRDQAESGYVSTRPRFTRVRRTWKQNVRNLVAEDVRALDEFFMVTTGRGGNSFLYPNLLLNWSFELPAINPTDLVFGWNVNSSSSQVSVGIATATVADGAQAIKFTSVAGTSVPADTTVSASLQCDKPIACSPGEVYTVALQMNAVQGSLASGVLIPAMSVNYLDASGNPLSSFGYAFTVAAGWQTVGDTFTVPAGAASFVFGLFVQLVNAGGSALSLDSSASVTFDAVGCALLTPLTPYGRMVGSQPLGCLVRFTKLPECSDIGFGGGVKRYGASFELTEV